MKRGIVFVLMAILVAGTLAIFSPTPKRARADSTKDQSCANVDEMYYMTIGNNPPEQQSFVPTQNRLTDVVLKLGGYNFNGDATVRILSEDTPIASKTITFSTSTPIYRTFTFATPVTLTPSSTYKIWIDDSATASPLYWYTNTDPNCCPSGSAFWGGSAQIPDFDFATWGYSVSEPENPPADGQDNQGTTGTTGTTGTGETLGTATSAIAKPLELTAAYSETDRGVKLAWKASATADIDGYKIFRSENASKGYTKIKETAKDKLDYLDQDIAAGKTYYYQLRAYKSDQQSYSSNTASAKIPDDIVPAKPKNLTVIEVTTNTLSVKWAKSAAADLKGYTISLYKGDEKIRTKDLDKDESLYHFIGLDSGAMYKVELIAKNDKDKTSTPAITYGATEYPEEIASFFNRLTIVGCVLILGLLGYLVYRVIVTRKAKTD
ncbi:hypothetical protein AUJ40_01725 [Candidatus Berkelbacteria bacterium CG1_02_42_45]|uniref:Fibronectin type-III domain-containing protein n=2 Tax=Candidatus Berkelbacteria TaxID=1618330 RepID=A0A1J4RQ54_9BACT|nr:MAG: hypothetical protein AUJ40_01725 [Candidatus Berkelbacteria bacterium CG1_02_42_45]